MTKWSPVNPYLDTPPARHGAAREPRFAQATTALLTDRPHTVGDGNVRAKYCAVSQANVEVVQAAYDSFRETGQFAEQFVTPDFVWDMSKFRDWPEQQVYEGADGARRFLADWRDAWEDWEIEVDSYHDAGEKVVALLRQRGRSKASGLPVDMRFAQVWTVQGGKQTRMEMYADPDEAMEAVGLQQ